MEKVTKYGKIYNKKKSNYNAMAMVYQSSNNCKMYNQHPAKSLGKPQKKYTTYNKNISLEKHHNKDILLKTEAKGFYIEGSEDKLFGEGDSPRKNQFEIGWQSTRQLPFLILTGQQQHSQEPKTLNSKKIPQPMMQKKSLKSQGQKR